MIAVVLKPFIALFAVFAAVDDAADTR